LSVGEEMLENFDPEWVRMANGFGEGIAGHGDVCGAIVGSVMVIGALYGRKDLTEDQSTNWRLCAEYYRRFEEALSATSCRAIQDSKSGNWTYTQCARTVKVAMQILFDILAEEAERRRNSDSPAGS